MKKKIIATVLLTAALVLTGCSAPYAESSDTDQVDGNLYEQNFRLSDGRTVTCIVFRDNYKGGVTCDWENAGGSFSE